MRKFYDILRQNLIISKTVIRTYSVIALVFYSVILVFFSGDYGNGSDVIVILDIGFIMLFLLISYPFVSHMIYDDKRMITSRVLFGKSNMTYFVKLLISLIVTYSFPVIYYLIKYIVSIIINGNGGFIDSYIIPQFMMICSISIILYMIFQYYMNIIRFKVNSKIFRFLPVILLLVFVVFYIGLGLTFDALVFEQYRGTNQYWEYLHLFENITYIFAGVLIIIFMRFQVKLYGKVSV